MGYQWNLKVGQPEKKRKWREADHPRVPAGKSSGGQFKIKDGDQQKIVIRLGQKGGPGSGNFGHSGRPGQVGGSTSSGHGRWSKDFSESREELLESYDGEYWESFFHTEDVLTAPTIDTTELDFINYGDDTGLIAQYAGEEWGDWAQSLTREQKRALNDYTTEYYQEVNSYLRTGVPSSRLEHIEEFFPEQDVPDMVSKLDSAMTARATSPMILSRGGGGSRLASLSEGDMFIDDAFVSTTLDQNWAKHFTGTSRSGVNVLTRIHIPKGQKMAYTGYYRTGYNDTVKSVGSHGAEWEVLLPRGMKFRVKSNKLLNNLHVIDLEVIP